nr:hypothetical protein [Brachybacterium saurashtrense]
MGAAPFGSDPVGVEKRLNLLPGVDVDQRLVDSGVLGAFVADDADVVRVAQQLEESGPCDRTGWTLRCRDGGQAARGDLGEEVHDGAFPGGVLLEHPPHQGCTIGVDLDGAVLPSLLVALADVEVADRCTHGGAAGLELLREWDCRTDR